MSIDRVLIEAGPGESRVALVDGERLVELVVARADGESVAGNVYLGRVQRLLPAIQAAFVDIGARRAGFLALAEVRPIGAAGEGGIADYASEGDAILVQAVSDPAADKGARLTSRVALPGRYLVATPSQPEIKVSRQLEDGETRARLIALMGELADEGEGFIVRTAAARADREALRRDLAYLRAAWDEVTERRAAARPPALLYREPEPLHRVLRDQAGLAAIVVDGAPALAEARAVCRRLAPEMEGLVEEHRGQAALFDAYGLEEQIEAALEPVAGLPSGGNIVIEATKALTAIDVNSGGHGEGGPEETALAVNLEAAAEIARQVRLRNIGGLIAIDFLPMRRRRNGAEVLHGLRRALAGDPCPSHVVGFTRLGLVEVTRQRRRAALADVLLTPCPACAGRGRGRSPETVAFGALRRVRREAAANPGAALAVTAAPAVIAALEGAAQAGLEALAARLGRAPALIEDRDFPPERVDVGPLDGGGDG